MNILLCTKKIQNSNLEEVIRVQGASKVMTWAGFIDGRFLLIYWFEGSVNGNS